MLQIIDDNKGIFSFFAGVFLGLRRLTQRTEEDPSTIKFRRLDKAEKIGKGRCADVYTFCTKQEELFVCKVFRDDDEDFAIREYPGETLPGKAECLNRVCVLLKKYLGDYLAESFFTTGINKSGKHCVMAFQEFVEGRPLPIFSRHDPKSKYYGQYQDIRLKLAQLEQDEDFRKLPETVQDIVLKDIHSHGNIFINDDQKLKVIDW
jgi:hypothetical protein